MNFQIYYVGDLLVIHVEEKVNGQPYFYEERFEDLDAVILKNFKQRARKAFERANTAKPVGDEHAES